MESKVIEFSMITVWEWIIQLISLGIAGLIIVILITTLFLLIRKLKKKD